MFRDAKKTKFSQLKNGDTFMNYDAEIMTVHNIKFTKSGRVRFDYTSDKQLKPRQYSNGALIDRLINGNEN